MNGIDSDENCSNPFDQIKQTCQNLFTSFTDKIASDLNFDLKQTTSSSNGTTNNQNIFTQPRSTQIPPQQQFGNYNNSSSGGGSNIINLSTSNQQSSLQSQPNNSVPISNNLSSPSSGRLSAASNSTLASPVNSVNLTETKTTTSPTISNKIAMNNNNNHPIVHTTNKPLAPQQPVSSTLCDCSDDEMITQFQTNYHKRQKSINENDPEAGPSGVGPTGNLTANSEIKQSLDDCSTTSSFEELGAVGGATTNDTENWQIINNTMISDDLTNIKRNNDKTELYADNSKLFQILNYSNDDAPTTTTTISTISDPITSNQLQQLTLLPSTPAAPTTTTTNARVRHQHQLSRRRSDSFVLNAITTSNLSLISNENNEEQLLTDGITPSHQQQCRKKSKQSCHKCGKGKGTLRKHVEKFKQQLETSNASEAEIREQLQAFLQYLETCNRYSTECSDTESNDGNNSILRRRRSSLAASGTNNVLDEGADLSTTMQSMSENDLSPSSYRFGDDDGIHVYGVNDDISSSYSGGGLLQHQTKPVICLSDYEL